MTTEELIARLECIVKNSADEETAQMAIQRLRELSDRLEVDSRHPYDGIDCRDETIRLLDAKIKRYEQRIQDLEDRVNANTAGTYHYRLGYAQGEQDALAKIKEGGDCQHDWNYKILYTSNPPQVKCNKCGKYKYVGEMQ